ncbi:MAG: DUF3303 family protein [Phycisphaerales bacterium]
MLFMVIERFNPGKKDAIGERFRAKGRMLPQNVQYVASWLEESTGELCFQLMEAPDAAALDPWIAKWSDLAGFEIVPVLSSADYWAREARRQRP